MVPQTEKTGEKKSKGRLFLLAMGVSLFTTFFWVETVGLTPIFGDMILDDELFWKLRPSWIAGVNEDGYRGRRLEPADLKTPNRLRIASFGDSSTYGLGIFRPGQVYPALLEQGLNETGLPCVVANFGVPGYAISQGAKLFEKKLEETRLDVATFLFGHNEWKTSRTGLADSNRILARAPFQNSLILRLSRTARLWQFLRSRWTPKVKPKERPLPRVSLDEFEGLVTRCIELSRARKVLFLWVEYVEIEENERQRPYVEKARRLCREKGVIFVEMDVLRTAGEKAFLSDGSHPGKLGHRLIAEALARAIRREMKR